MPADLYRDFVSSEDTLRIYLGEKLVFRSKKDRLLPLMDYFSARGKAAGPVVIFDKIMGNAAALLAIMAGCREVYSPLGSELAIDTLDARGILHHLERTVPFIMRDDGTDMCPMERLSIGKGPEEFYLALKTRIEAARKDPA